MAEEAAQGELRRNVRVVDLLHLLQQRVFRSAHFCRSYNIQAASFGKTFLDLYNPVDFVAMSQTLRVLNAVRYYEIGMPITYDQ